MKVPYIADLEKMSFEQLDLAMETGAAKGNVASVNWEKDWGYRPDVAFSIARSASHLAVLYHVRGLDLRAQAMQDNGRVWEDSCCEFFVMDQDGEHYFNFELNCIGTLLCARRTGRKDAIHLAPEQLQRVIRHITIEKKSHEEIGKIFSWSVAMVIPLDLIGIDGMNLPKNLRANFLKCGDKTAHPHFLSWNPILTPSPDFHRPEFFGELTF